MIGDTRATLVFVAVLVCSLPAGVGFGAATTSGDTVTLDDDTALTANSTIENFETEGIATANPTYPNMTITVADSATDVGVDGLRYTDFDTTYLRVDYDESIERTIRFYVPKAYWHPHPDEPDAIDGETTATFEPTEGSNYTAVEMHLSGETDAVFEIKQQASVVFSVREYGSEWLEDEIGVDMPSTNGASEQWEYVPTAELTGDNPTFGIDTDGEDVTLQYDAAKTADPASKEWRTVPECADSSGADAPVCTFTKDNSTETVHILAQTDDPPDVRFKYGSGWLANIRSSIGELLNDIPRDLVRDARDIVDGVFNR
ncbi:hypothetical protein [Natrinema ejinorense]|uniref:Uncharacterized protein n=1 Tax=Natrinema ejinorense TaxID=373386 RepID=A0A2A5QPM8_9EURY|nr:hypothetical protein [Natrinema ejinorense]PCR88693.1 hypothetical protein CP557_21940 [Natrinema ejinorense]